MSKQLGIFLFILLIVFTLLSRGFYLNYPSDTVFDEVHYVKAARAYLAGEPDTNWEHPPLGKMFIALGMTIFGDNALGWRFFPFLLGSLAVILVFLLGRTLNLGIGGSLLAASFYAFDFLAFVQGRLAMLDIFVAFFCLLALFFAARFYRTRWPADFLLTLVSLGCAMASKWSALYLIIALGVFFLVLPPFFPRLRGASRYFASGFVVFLCFLVVTGGVYLFSYLYYFSFDHSLQDLVKLHTDAWAWHTRPNIDHPYASSWWSWPLMTKGVWYYYQTTPAGLTEGILAIGNPLVWYLGALALLAMLFSLPFWLRQRDRFVPFWILFGYLINYLPWIISSKGGFIFYMLPAVPFYGLAMAYLAARSWRRVGWRFATWTVFALALLAFLAFYPLLTGLPIYPETLLKGIWSGSFLHIFGN